MKANDNEILTIAGNRVRVEYKECRFHPCGDCCFEKNGKCLADRECLAFDNHPGKKPYFVPAEESDADKAAEEACAKCPISGRCFVEDKGRKDACDYLRGVKAGIAYERERMMKFCIDAVVVTPHKERHLAIPVNDDTIERALSECKDGDKVKLIILK